jgi:hypothetical protein
MCWSLHLGEVLNVVFGKARGWLLGAVFSIVGTAIGIQFGLLGPNKDFLTNLVTTAVIWVGSRVLAGLVSRY